MQTSLFSSTSFFLIMLSGALLEDRLDLVIEVGPTRDSRLPAELWITLDRDAANSTVFTSGQGIVRFDDLTPGQYWVVVEKEGYQSSRVEFSAASSQGNQHLIVDPGATAVDIAKMAFDPERQGT